jgi:NTE family protein
MKKSIWLAGLCLAAICSFGQSAPTDTGTKRLLVISGGGARGAWGAGALSELIQKNGGYTAVFGTSTGSLMAPMILLKDMDLLDSAYTHVTQDSIFSKNPFNVKYDAGTGTVTTSLNFRAVLRFIFGKRTFGETGRLLTLIHHFLTRPRYDSLISLYRSSGMVLAVAVTNTRTGLLKMVYDSAFTATDTGYEQMCRWIWASANEPLYMSYVPMGDTSYVDGGVREVIPIQEGLIYAIHHDIDAIDVVINNAKVPIDQNWNVAGGGILYGLERLLEIYDLGTVHYNETYAILLARYFDLAVSLPHPDAEGNSTTVRSKHMLHMNFYCMPQDVATKYQNELGFIQPAMMALLLAGKTYGANPGQGCFSIDIDKEVIKQHLELFNNNNNK